MLLCFQAPNVTSAAWNSQIEDMLCYAGNGQLFIKSGDFAAHPLPMEGDVVGFAGSKVFVLQYFGARPEMRVVDVRCSFSDRDCYFKAIMTALFAYFTAMFLII